AWQASMTSRWRACDAKSWRMYVSCRSAAIRNRLPGYSISFDKKKQYSQSRLQIAPVGLAMMWNAAGASGRVSSGLAAVSVASVIAGSVRRVGGQAQLSPFPVEICLLAFG